MTWFTVSPIWNSFVCCLVGQSTYLVMFGGWRLPGGDRTCHLGCFFELPLSLLGGDRRIQLTERAPTSFSSAQQTTEWSDFQRWSETLPTPTTPPSWYLNLWKPDLQNPWHTKFCLAYLWNLEFTHLYRFFSKVICFAELCQKSFEECLCRFIERLHWSERREKRRMWTKRKKRRWNHDLSTFEIGGILYAGLMQMIYSSFQEEDAASPVKSVLASFGTQVSSIWNKYL